MKIVLKNSYLVFQKEGELQWTEVLSVDNRGGWSLLGNQFSNGDTVMVKVEVISAAPAETEGAILTSYLGVCNESQSIVHSVSAFMYNTAIEIHNTTGYISDIYTITIEKVNEKQNFVIASLFNPPPAQKLIKLKWYFYKVQ